MYDFDEIIGRRGTSCIKYDRLGERFGRDDLSALWVADMDFRTPDFIIEALRDRLDHPVLGYPTTPDDYFRNIAAWVERLHGWKVDPRHICFIPGIVKGFAIAQRCFLKPGDKVIIQTPVYHPFRITTESCGFEAVCNPLRPVYASQGRLTDYEMDLDGLEALIDGRTKMMLLCSPHNPGGIVWPEETLRRLASICRRHGIIVISDEIHGEMIFRGSRHHPFGSVSEDARQCSICFLAPSKTFNIAGVVSSYCIVENPELREKLFSYIEAGEFDYPSIFSTIATTAAYSPQGEAWRKEMMEYVEGNVDFVASWLEENLPEIYAVRPRASFLIWLDCRKLGLSQAELVDLFVNRARLALNDGSMFGKEGEGFMRMNVGCPRKLLEEALVSLKAAVRG